MTNRVFVIGVGMTRFEKPGKRDDFDYPAMVREAATKALTDANITYDAVEQAYCSYVYGDSTCGQRALYPLGLTGIPIVNLNNNCSSGSSGLMLARNAIASGAAHCVMAVGFEKMAPGSLSSVWNDRTNPLDPHLSAISSRHEINPKTPMAPLIFGLAGQQYCARHGVQSEDEQRRIMARIAWKNHLHSTRNPYSQFQDEYTLEQIEKSRKVAGPLTMLQCCPTSDGSACVILASEQFVRQHHLEPQAIEIAAMVMKTDVSGAFGDFFESTDARANYAVDPQAVSFEAVAGSEMTRAAAKEALAQARITPDQVRLVELHDCFSANELITYDALGLCPSGTSAVDFAKSLDRAGSAVVPTHPGIPPVVVNISGGLLSKGHPLGATGLAQCTELTWQLREWCGPRQVEGIECALQHNIGLGGAAVVAVYKKPHQLARSGTWVDPRQRFGYNPAVEAREVTDAMVERVRARAAAATPQRARL